MNIKPAPGRTGGSVFILDGPAWASSERPGAGESCSALGTSVGMNRKHMADTFRPGDIWRHNNGMGNLAVTGELGCKPGYLKCYWMMGGNSNAPSTCMDPKRTKHFTLVSRMNPDAQD